MSFFKGYLPTKDKKCLKKYTGKFAKNIIGLEEANKLDEYAGILAEDSILIDVDDYDQSEILLNIVDDLELRCRVYATTRGKHFLFKNTEVDKCKTGTRLACGLTADIKSGLTNSYSILKFGGKEREILYDKLDDEEYQELPKWLYPVDSKINWLDMGEGDGRNQELFNYILTLQANEFTNDEARESIRILNKYVLKEPLDEGELEVILREDAFKKQVFYKGKQFLYDKFARYLKEDKHIIRLNGQLHMYQEGIYVNGNKYIEAEMIKLIPNLNRSQRSEVLSYLELLCSDNSKTSSPNLIAFKNGVYDLLNDELHDFSHEFTITNQIPHNYNAEATSEVMDNTLNKLACKDAEIRALLEEVIGSVMYRSNTLGSGKAFILIGDKSNGKSTFLYLIEKLVGGKNRSSLDLKELDFRFKTAELVNKLVNVGDDIGDEFITNPAIFKKLVTGNSVNVERKGDTPFDFSNFAKLLFSANKIPRINDSTGAVMRRLLIVPFNAVFSVNDADYDPHIKFKLAKEESIEYLIKLGIAGLKRVIDTKQYTKSIKVDEELAEYELENNPILMFFADTDKDEVINESVQSVYQRYQEYCIANNYKAMSNIAFSKQTCKFYDAQSVPRKVNGKSVRVFIQK